jgi:hypothetical protein
MFESSFSDFIFILQQSVIFQSRITNGISLPVVTESILLVPDQTGQQGPVIGNRQGTIEP